MTIAQPKAHSAIRAVLAREPELNAFGFGLFRQKRLSPAEAAAKLMRNRDAMLGPDALLQFERCLEWLEAATRTLRVNPRAGSSYALKHRVEDWIAAKYPGANSYVCNGVFIAAALHLGLKVEQIDGGPNAVLNIARRR